MISKHTKVSATVGSIALAIAALVGVGWRAANALRDVTDEMKSLRSDIRAVYADRWTTGDMERWTIRFERANSGRGLVVPDPRQDVRPIIVPAP